MMLSFAGYSFPFTSAYLRAHYPAEFLAAVISNQGGYYSAFAYLSEGRRMGLTVLLPDINASDWVYLGSDQAIRVGFMQIKSLREEFAKHIVSERQTQGPYRSLHDFLERLQRDVAQTKLHIKAGCFDSIAGDLTRPSLIWRLVAFHAGQKNQYLPIPREYSASQQWAHEWELFGFPVSQHPLDLLKDVIGRTPCIPACELAQHVGKTITVLGWLVTEKIVSYKKGEPMEFAIFEDQSALYDATFFPTRTGSVVLCSP